MKHLKKTLCLLLAVMMLLALGVPAMAAGEVPVDFFPGQQDQRQVDEQGEVADIDVQQVLQHGGQAVDARRGKGVGKDKQLIADAHQTGQTGCDRVAAQSGPRGMMLHRSASVF